MSTPAILAQVRIDAAGDPRSSRHLTVFEDSVLYAAHGPCVRVESHLTHEEARSLAHAILANVPETEGATRV